MKSSIFKECLRIARRKNHTRVETFHHFTFIIQDNKIVEYGYNRMRTTQPLDLGYPKHANIHSENDAYKKAKGILDSKKEFEVINIRLNKLGLLRLSKPCYNCYVFLKVVGAKRVWFSTDIGFARMDLN